MTTLDAMEYVKKLELREYEIEQFPLFAWNWDYHRPQMLERMPAEFERNEPLDRMKLLRVMELLSIHLKAEQSREPPRRLPDV